MVNYEYDSKGRKTSVDLNGQKGYVTYTYNDTAGTTVTTAPGGMQSKQDMYGNVLETSYNGAKQTQSTYDAQNRLTELKDLVAGTTEKITYDSTNHVEKITGGKVAENYTYDLA